MLGGGGHGACILTIRAESVNSLAIITLAPLIAWMWIKMGSANPSIPRKFGLGIIFNGLAFLLLMFALSSLVDPATLKIPFWTLFMVYVIQSIGELFLSPKTVERHLSSLFSRLGVTNRRELAAVAAGHLGDAAP